MANQDYYKILGVSQNASADEIKKAFRKLAHQHHPDKKGGDEAKFKEINTAYQVLSDPTKRKQYDQFGANFDQPGGAGGGFNWQDFSRAGAGFNQNNINFDFGNFNDLGDIFGDFFGGGINRNGSPRARRTRGADLEFTIAIDFREAVFGMDKTLRFEKKLPCSHCHGKGAEPGSKTSNCAACRGSGQIEQMQRTFLGAMRTVVTCPTCQGDGQTNDKQCAKCHGRGIEHGVKELKIKIPAGINNEQTIRLNGEGEPGNKGGQAGDLLLTIRVKPDKTFKREGFNLFTTKQVSIKLAILGGKVLLQTLDGEVYLKIPAGTQNGAVIKLQDKGVPYLHSHKRGDLLVSINVHIPQKISKKQREALATLDINLGEEIDSKNTWFN